MTRTEYNHQIAIRIAQLREERSERTKIDADHALTRLAEVDQMDIFNNTGNIKPIDQWPTLWRSTVSGLDSHEILSGDTATIIRKIKWPDKVKNLS